MSWITVAAASQLTAATLAAVLPFAMSAGLRSWPLLQFGPELGVLILTCGLGLILVELNRPGLVVPGAVGLLLVLLTLNSWRFWQLHAWAVILLAVGLLLPVAQSWWGSALPGAVLEAVLGAAGSVAALITGFHWVIAGPAPASVQWPAALACGLSLGLACSVLARVACRARQNKALIHDSAFTVHRSGRSVRGP